MAWTAVLGLRCLDAANLVARFASKFYAQDLKLPMPCGWSELL